MELIKKNIHMDRIKAEAVSQFTLEDDMNIPESKPDVNSLNMEKGSVTIEEVKPGTDMVMVKGMFNFCILYHTNEDGSSLVSLEGRIPFEEKINIQGVGAGDYVEVYGETDDLTVELINSRKLSIQLIITLNAKVEEVYDEEVPIGIAGTEQVEYRKVPISLGAIAICKNDIFRIKEEVTLPAAYPNVFQILWNNIFLSDVEFKAMEEKLTVQGDVHMFILYEGEGEEHPIRSFETTLPFSGVLECHGCREGMIPDIGYRVGQQEIVVRPDFDGEERSIGLELVLDISMHVYEEEQVEVISDIYGVQKEVDTATSTADLRHLLSRVTGKTKVTDHVKVPAGSAAILQLIHSEGKMAIDRTEAVENGILIEGSLMVKVMYVTGDDYAPYAGMKAVIPYQYTLEVPGITERDLSKVHGDVEQLQVTMLDGEEIDIKAILGFSTTVFQNVPLEIIKEVKIADIDNAKLNGLPGMVIYIAADGDNLWNIGKKYYVPVDKLKKVNNLDSDELQKGQKLLIVK